MSSAAAARPVIIDTDPGIDDALAVFLALASPELEVIGLTSVYGNVSIEATTHNALCLLELAGRGDIPVARGAAGPMASAYRGAIPHIHGDDGQGNANLAAPAAVPQAAAAHDWMYARAAAAPGQVTLLALGPLTNLALALQRYPDFPAVVREIVLMGGNALCPGNASPAAEANIFNDPEAADLVFAQDWPVTMIGLDITRKVVLRPADVDAIVSRDTAPARHLSTALGFYQSFFASTNRLDGLFAHDPTAVAYLLDESLFNLSRWPVCVETEGISRGKTWPYVGAGGDEAPQPWRQRPPVAVATEVDAAAVVRLIVERTC